MPVNGLIQKQQLCSTTQAAAQCISQIQACPSSTPGHLPLWHVPAEGHLHANLCPGVRHLKLILYFLKITNKLKQHNHISLSKCIMSISCDKLSQIMSLIIVCSTGNKSYGSSTPRCLGILGKHPVTIGDCSLNLTCVTNSIFLPLNP